MKASRLCAALAFAALLVACATTTEITSSKKAPNAEPIERGKKVLALVVAKDAKNRRKAEDELARQLAHGTPAYKVFRDEELRDPALVRQRLSEQGFAYGVVMKVVDVDSDTRPASPTLFTEENMWESDEDFVWNGAPINTSTVRMVTSLYSVEDGSLLWEAESNSINPTKMDALVDDVARAAGKRLKKDGLVAAK
jgi:hypothetical protein